MHTLIIRNARIFTLDPARPRAEAMVTQGERILAVGSEALAQTHLTPSAQVIDARGAVIVPGFIDTHAHLAVTGLGLLALDCTGIASIPTLLNRIRAASDQQPGSALLIALNFQPELNPENRYPTPLEMDSAAGGRPVYLMNRTGHECGVNAAALALLDLPAGTPGVGQTGDGRFDGVLAAEANSQAFTRFWAHFAAQVGLERALTLGAQKAAQGGITTLHALDDLDTVSEMLQFQSRLPARIVPYTQTRDVNAVRRLGLHQIGGCGTVMVDGDFSPHTAALLEPYADRPETSGKLYYTDEELAAYVEEAHTAGLQVALHCVGSAAIEQLLNAYERALARHPRTDHRHRIEHFELPAPGQAERAHRLGVCLALQPAFNHYWPHDSEYPALVGSERAARVDPLGSLLDMGLALGLGSDSPVTPLQPLLWIHSGANHSNPDERISAHSALELTTRGGSYLAFEEGQKGMLAPGRLADFIFLDEHPAAVPVQQICNVRVLKTFLGGRTVFDADGELQ
jgi:predicted amidohydrolase YtcJ